MMKRFEKSGKLLALAFLAVALVFAGCTAPGGGSSSSESAPAGTDSQGSYGTVPISIDGESGRMEIGESGLYDVISVDGRSVEVKNGDTSISGGLGQCSGSGGDVQCWIKVINRDPDEYMANVFLYGTACTDCVDAVMDTADLSHGGTTTASGDSIVDVPPEIGGVGVCYAEDGVFPARFPPFNEFGCSSFDTPGVNDKPIQHLHPECGQRSELWDFGVQAAQYHFTGYVEADFFPFNPAGADRTPGTADDDPRYDFENYTTIYVMLSELDNVGPAVYRYGSYLRSTALAGYGAATDGVTLAPGRYFGLSLAIEYPNRIEGRPMAERDLFPANGYEYYNQYAMFFRYDPFVVEKVAGTHKTGAGSIVRDGAQYMCFDVNDCTGIGKQSYSHLDPISEGTNVYSGPGWIGTYRSIATNFAYFGTRNYYWDNTALTPAKLYASGLVPQEGGHKGVAYLDTVWAGQSLWSINTGIRMTQEGVDAAPEMPISFWYFWVKGTSGEGSSFWVDTFGSFTQFNMAHTALTYNPSGTKGGTDDWTDYCAPYYTGGDQVHFCEPGQPTSVYVVGQGVENMNPNIGQQGELTPGRGGIQQWPAYICVQ